MRRKNPKSHSYTIGCLVLVMLISGFSAWSIVSNIEPDKPQVNRASLQKFDKTPLAVTSPHKMQPLNPVPLQDGFNPGSSPANVQSSNAGAQLQAASNSQAYGSFEAGRSGLQPQRGRKAQ